VVDDGEVEFVVDGFAVVGVGVGQDGHDPFELADEGFDLVAGEAGLAGGGAEGGFGCFAGELDFLDPAVDDGGVGAGFEVRR
jgi:hypothetical protein